VFRIGQFFLGVWEISKMSRKGSIAPAPLSTVVTIHSLNQALHPGGQGEDIRIIY